MTAREFMIVEVTVIDGGSLLPLVALAARRWRYSAAAHGAAFAYSNTQLVQDPFKQGARGVPREYRPFGHLAFIQIKSYAGCSLKALLPAVVSIWDRLALGAR